MRKANISGKKIKEIRLQKRLDQVELAAALDVDFALKFTQSNISGIERGIRGVKDYELAAIAAILDVDINILLYGDE